MSWNVISDENHVLTCSHSYFMYVLSSLIRCKSLLCPVGTKISSFSHCDFCISRRGDERGEALLMFERFINTPYTLTV